MYECTHFCKRPCSPLRFLFLCLQQRLCPHVSTSHSIVNTSKFALTLVSFPQYICNTKLLFRKCALFAMCFNCSKFVLNFVGSLSFFFWSHLSSLWQSPQIVSMLILLLSLRSWWNASMCILLFSLWQSQQTTFMLIFLFSLHLH
jgi:hypothetical protein